MSFDKHPALVEFCSECEIDLQKAVFNNKFMRYGKKFSKNLFLCMLCLTKEPFHAHWQYTKEAVDFGAWNSKTSRFPNVFLSVTLLEMRKHLDGNHHGFPNDQQHYSGLVTAYVSLSSSINEKSWEYAALQWSIKIADCATKTEKLSQGKLTMELKKWSLDSFGHDYTSIVDDRYTSECIELDMHLMGKKRSFLPIHRECSLTRTTPPKRELTIMEKEMSTAEFILYACKNSPPCPELPTTIKSTIANMSHSDFLAYSNQAKQRRRAEYSSKNQAIIRYDELEDFSDEVTFGFSDEFPNMATTRNELVGKSLSLVDTTNTNTTVPLFFDRKCNVQDNATTSIVQLENSTPPCRSSTNHFSLPALQDCPLDPHFVDERSEWGDNPPLCIYSPSILFTPIKLHQIGCTSTAHFEPAVVKHSEKLKLKMKSTLITDLELKLNTLREKNHMFVSYYISPKYKNYKLMYEAVLTLNNKTAMELSLCTNKSRKQIILKGMFCILIIVSHPITIYFVLRKKCLFRAS
jgi:hypothetical protein